MPQRIDLDAQLNAPRKAIDADWTGRKKALVGGAAGLLAVVALGMGVMTFLNNRPPKLPTTAQEAVLVLTSSNFEKLDGERKNDLRMEAVRLLREASDEERRELFSQFDDPEVRRQIGEAFMEDMVRQFARTGEFQFPFGNPGMMGVPGGGRPGGWGGRPGGEGGRPAEGGAGGGEGGREGRGGNDADRRSQMANRIVDRMANGDAQTTALMGEFFRAMRAQREQAQRGGGGGG